MSSRKTLLQLEMEANIIEELLSLGQWPFTILQEKLHKVQELILNTANSSFLKDNNKWNA